jgi:hypothetical protein
MGFEVLVAVNIQITNFLDMTPCSLKNINVLEHPSDPLFKIEIKFLLNIIPPAPL